MKLKKFAALIAAVGLCVSLFAACSSSAAGSSAPAASSAAASSAAVESAVSQAGSLKGKTIGVLVVTTQSQWCNAIIDGVTKVAEAEGASVIVSDSQVSVDNELSGMENLINSGCAAIVVNAMNAAGLSDLCAQAQAKGIYVIGWSKLLGNYDALVQEDYDKESELITGAIADYVDANASGGCEMAEIWLADAANPDTNAGLFKAALEKAFDATLVTGKNVKVVNSQYATDTNAAMNTAEAILAANPNVKVIFCQSDEMGVAVSQTLQAKGIAAGSILVCGLDGTDEAIKAIASGTSCLGATVYADADKLGEAVGESVVNDLKTGTATDVVTEYTLIDKSNASQFAAQ